MVQPVRPGRKVQVNNLRLMTVVTWGAEGRSIPVDGWEGQWSLKNQFGELPAWEVTYPLPKVLLKIIILFSRWDMLVFWRVLSIVCLLNHIYPPSGYPVLLLLLSCPFQSARSVLFKAAVEKRNGMGGWPGRKIWTCTNLQRSREHAFFWCATWEMHGISMASLRTSEIFLDSNCNLAAGLSDQVYNFGIW